VILNHATLSRRATLQVAERCNAAGLEFLDAPFTGSRMAAEQGQLCYYVGGPQPLLARVRGLLQLSSAQILHLGGIGEATVLKLVTNLITAVTVKALSEAVAITQACGIDAENLRRALEANANYSKLIGMKLGAMQSGDYAAHFSVVNMLKDADFAASLAADMGLDCGGLAAAAESLRRANEAGLSDQDFSSIHNLSNLNRS
jgi:3-hydroxyisobutyrate dehydrogenase-like beta-hydroxyacid dehydrogenase